MSHIAIYIGLSLAYVEAALESFAERKLHCAWREIVIACLYGGAALMGLIANPGLRELTA